MKKQIVALSISLFLSGISFAEYEGQSDESSQGQRQEEPSRTNNQEGGADEDVAATESAPGSRSRWYKDPDARKAYLRGGSDYKRNAGQDYRSDGYYRTGAGQDGGAPRSNPRWRKDTEARKAYLRGERDYNR